MSSGQRTLLLWAAIILLVTYLGNIDISGFVQSVIHAAQNVHQANSH